MKTSWQANAAHNGLQYDGPPDLDEYSEPPADIFTALREPESEQVAEVNGEPISNATTNGKSTEPLSMSEILANIKARTGGWPRRAGPALFVHESDHEVQWLEKSPSLSGWLGTRCPPPAQFVKSSGYHSMSEVFEEVKRTAKAYKAIETLPHEPPITDHYYACKFPEPGDGAALDGLLSRFNPATAIDRDLMLAMFATLIWGGDDGAPGCRPAFLMTGEEGRGVGKSKTMAMLGHLAGGVLDLSPNDDAGKIKTRILSAEGATKRVALLDNVKTMRFSWSEFEAMISSTEISGHRLFCGEGTRPNNLLYLITLNGASLSTDMAQRCVIIKIKRPVYSGNWEEDTRRYIDEHRQAIIGDLIAFLRSERKPLARYSRWGSWERDVLSRLPDPTDVQAMILERQGEADVEEEESDLIGEFFGAQLASLGYRPETDKIFIPSAIVGQWYNAATNERHSVAAAGRSVRQKIKEGKIKNLSENKSHGMGRGLIWTGYEWEAGAVYSDIETRLEAKARDATNRY